jgi:hypothetical protein
MYIFTGYHDFQSAPVWLGLLLAIVGVSVGCFVVHLLNSRYSDNIQNKNKTISRFEQMVSKAQDYRGYYKDYRGILSNEFNYAKDHFNTRNYSYDIEPVYNGAIIGALAGFFSCFCSCVAVQGDIENINVLYPASIVTLAILGAIAGAIVRVYCNGEIK